MVQPGATSTLPLSEPRGKGARQKSLLLSKKTVEIKGKISAKCVCVVRVLFFVGAA